MTRHNEKPDYRESDHTDFEESCRIDQIEDERAKTHRLRIGKDGKPEPGDHTTLVDMVTGRKIVIPRGGKYE